MADFPTFGIAETDDYVRKILGRAGSLPVGDLDALHAALVPHVMHQESRGNPRAVSPKGAVGTMQTMPATLRDPGFGVAPAKDDSDEERERVGKDYLKAMLKRYPGRPDLALAAYNAGPGRADRWAKREGIEPSARPAGGVLRASSGIEGMPVLAEEWDGLPEAEEARRGNFLSNAIGLDSTVAAIARLWEDQGVEFDADFNLTQLSDKEWEGATQGIPEEYWDGLASAGSRAHLDLLSHRLRARVTAEAELAAYGGWGIAGRFALMMTDPVALAVGISTGGLTAGTQGARLARAAAIARRAGKFDEAGASVRALETVAKGSAWRNVATVGALSAAENAGIEAVITASDTTRNGWDVAAAALTGGLLGGAASRVFSGRELRAVQGAYLRERSALELAELNHRLDLKQADLTRTLTDLDASRSTLADSDPDVARARAEIATIQRELREAAGTRRQELTTTAAGALKRSELGRLRRETQALRRQANKAEDLEVEVEVRMLEEDVATLGPDVARSKQRTKMRARAAKAEAATRRETIHANLASAETALGRGQAAEDALRELRKLEKAEAKGEDLLMLDEPGRNRFGERELAAAQDLQRALGIQNERLTALDAQRATVQQDLDGIASARAAGVRASDEILANEAAAVFGADTASAARFTGFDEGLHPSLESGLPVLHAPGHALVPEVGKMALAKAARTGPLATFSGILRGSDNANVRKLLGRMVGASAGRADKGVNTVGASEIHARLHESMTARFNTAVGPAYTAWGEKRGIGRLGRTTRTARTQFMEEVGLHVRGQDTPDPEIQKAAAGVRKVFKDYLAEAKEAGVKGLEEVEFNDRYLPRVFKFDRVYEIIQDIGPDNLRTLVRRAIQAENDDVPDKLASRIAKIYVERMRELRVGSDFGLMQGVRWDDVGFLRRFLDDAGVDSEEIEDIVGQFAAINLNRQRQTEGSFRSAKKRQQFDENFAMSFRSQNAAKAGRIEDVTITMSDLFENNVEALFGRYSRSVSGHIGLAKVGIKHRGDFDDSIKMVERELEGDPDELDRVRDTAELAYKLITGQPVQNATLLTKFGRAMRDYNFATVMNQAGFAQFPDLAGLLAKGYVGYTVRHFFDGFRMMKRTDGTLDDAFAREMESVLGLGSDYYNNATFSSYDPGEQPGFMGVLGAVEHGLRVAGRGTQAISGMAWITAMCQRMAGRVIVQRLVDDVLKGGKISDHRAATLGLDAAMKGRIAQQLKDHTVWVDGDFGGKVQIVNYAAWKDMEARDAMMYAVFREARRLVQEEDLGDTAGWMHMNWGKIIAQFRRFALVSYSRQLLHGVAHADAEEATRLMVSMVMAGMAYTARHELRLASLAVGGAEEDELEEYRSRYLTPDRLAAAAFANSTYSTVLPALSDSVTSTLFDERFFNTRTSGLGSDILTGNPTVSALNSLGNAVRGVTTAIVRGDRQFDQGDARALRRVIPFQNVYGLDAMFAALTADLPDQDEDADPDEFDWFFED